MNKKNSKQVNGLCLKKTLIVKSILKFLFNSISFSH